MSRRHCALVVSVLMLLAAPDASAAPICSSVAKFNEEAIAKGITARSGTLRFKATGIDANSGKGVLASLVDVRDKSATGGPCTGIYFKVYGPGVDLGKVKDELYNVCCKTCDTCTTERSGTLGCETWAGEARSSVIFTAPTQTCDFELRFGGTPNQHSYSVKCDDGKGDSGVGDNLYLVEVNRIGLLADHDGGGKTAGTISSDEFCYEPAVATTPDAGVDGGASSSTMTIVAAEDVTASNVSPTTVYGDVADLSCGDDSEFFLKFIVPSSVGSVKKATLSLTVAATTSAEGDGGALFAVSSNAWSETTLTWATKPTRGARLGRVGPPLAKEQKVTLDVTSAITGAGTYSFAMAVEPTDKNGTHFLSKEASSVSPPTLLLEYGPPTTPPPLDASAPDTATPPTIVDSGADATPAARPAPPEGDFTGGCQYGAPASSTFAALLAFSTAIAIRAARRSGRRSP